MPLSAGRRLGPYEIVSPLGAGGMGEVYRARDTRLGRDVAIKVLPAHLSANPEVRARFEREARAVSQLNHPHICTLHDIGHQDDGPDGGAIEYIVMELVEGETLSKRLERGALPVEQALRAAIEIADALDRAHRSGIVHRDLKPGNIMLTKSGAKLLDFGLARAIASAVTPGAQAGSSARGDFSQSPTVSRSLTAEGTIVGTLAYMAPEQLEAKESDARADIFAFGATLYEMISGRRAFEAKSQASLIAAIMHIEPPPLAATAPLAPPALERVVRRCLAKDPDDRWQTARDLMHELRWIAGSGESAGVGPHAAADSLARAAGASASHASAGRGPSGAAPRRERIAWALAAIATLATLALAVALAVTRGSARRSATSPSAPVCLTITPPDENAFSSDIPDPSPPAISPDGSVVVFGARDATGTLRLWVRPLAAFEARPLGGTEGAIFPFWSPDSRHIGFFAEGKLKRIEAAGGVPQVIADSPGSARGGAWNEDGAILFTPTSNEGLFRVPANGGDAVRVTHPDTAFSDISHRFPSFLPDQRHFLFLTWSNSADVQQKVGGIYVGSLDSPETNRILTDLSRAEYAEPGHIVFARARALVASAFDARKLTITGSTVSIASELQYSSLSGNAVLSVSRTGSLLYRTGAEEERRQVVWLDRSGAPIDTLGQPVTSYATRISPDGRRAVMEIRDGRIGTNDLWILDLGRDVLTRFTFGPSSEWEPIWSPDGKRIAFASDATGNNQCYVKVADGSADQAALIESHDDETPSDWSPDGRVILINRAGHDDTASELLAVNVDDGSATTLVSSETWNARFSPDGNWIAYTSAESGRPEVYVRSFPGPGGRWQVSTHGGTRARWRADGGEILYEDPTGMMTAVEVSRGAAFEAGVPRPLFQITTGTPWDASADHGRILAAQRVAETMGEPIRVIVDWASTMRDPSSRPAR